MQVMALGKWSKEDGRWKMVVAMRRPNGVARSAPATSVERAQPQRRPVPNPEKR